SLSQVEPVVAAFKNDSVAHFDGALHVDLTAKGWLKQYTLDLAARGHALAMNGFQVESVTVTAAGTVDSLNFGARLAVDSVTALALGGRSSGRGASVMLDSLLIERADAIWTMAQGGSVRMAGGKWAFDSVTIARDPAPGQLVVTGSMPGKITVRAEAVPLIAVLGKGKRDSLPDL